MTKSADAFRTISEASKELDVPQHVLRHWEDVFGHIRPMRRAGGRRYYRPVDLDLLRGVRALLYDERYTTKGVQKIFRENGAKYITELGQRIERGDTVDIRGDLDGNSASDDAPTTTQAVAQAADLAQSSALDTEKLRGLIDRLKALQENLDNVVLAIDAISQDNPVGSSLQDE